MFERLPGLKRQLAEIRQIAGFASITGHSRRFRRWEVAGSGSSTSIHEGRADHSTELERCGAAGSLSRLRCCGSKRGGSSGSVADRDGDAGRQTRAPCCWTMGGMALTMQPKLLRCIEKRIPSRRCNSDRTRGLQRCRCSTNRDLTAMAKRARSVRTCCTARRTVVIPPLCEQQEDVEPLAMFLIADIVDRREFEVENGFLQWSPGVAATWKRA